MLDKNFPGTGCALKLTMATPEERGPLGRVNSSAIFAMVQQLMIDWLSDPVIVQLGMQGLCDQVGHIFLNRPIKELNLVHPGVELRVNITVAHRLAILVADSFENGPLSLCPSLGNHDLSF
jgi:hypothetical protein